MNTNDAAEDEAKLVLDIYEYSLTNGLDVEDRSDVEKILEALNQVDVSDEKIERLMKALQITTKRIQEDLSDRKKLN
jgi:hypothetical protein